MGSEICPRSGIWDLGSGGGVSQGSLTGFLLTASLMLLLLPPHLPKLCPCFLFLNPAPSLSCYVGGPQCLAMWGALSVLLCVGPSVSCYAWGPQCLAVNAGGPQCLAICGGPSVSCYAGDPQCLAICGGPIPQRFPSPCPPPLPQPGGLQVLSQLPQQLAHASKAAEPGLLLVGYAMRASREKDLAAAGILHMVPRVGVSESAE